MDGKFTQVLHNYSPLALAFAGTGLTGFIIAVVLLIRGYGFNNLKGIRSFGLMVLLGSLVFPMLAAFPVRLVGWDPLDYSSTESLLHTASFVIPMLILSIVVGLWWDRRAWSINAAIFYVIFILL